MSETVFAHHRGSDGEHVGYMRMTADETFVPIDLMWNELSAGVPFDAAEETLDEIGLSYLAEDWYMFSERDGRRIRVRISEVQPDSITVRTAEFGIPDDIGVSYRLPNPSELLHRTAE